MNILSILLFVHILLMVFWLGTDVGVFISALRYIDARRPISERAAVMDLGVIIDRYPRICFVAILPVGMQMAWLLGLVAFPVWVIALVWAIGAIWMVTVVNVIVRAGTPSVRWFQIVERVLLVTGGLIIAGSGLAGLIGMIAMPAWFAGKLLMFGAICGFALLLDHSFGPVVTAFEAIAAQGSTPERETLLRARMWHSLRWVLAIYAALLVAGFLGTVKP